MLEHREVCMALRCHFTIFVGAGSSAGIQLLQRVSVKLDQFGRSHISEQAQVAPVVHLL